MMLDDSEAYQNYQEQQQKKWEALCLRCGACCGALDDPCVHLIGTEEGKYYCDTYEDRFGEQMTRSGKKFQCVPIQEKLHQSWLGDECCGYKK